MNLKLNNIAFFILINFILILDIFYYQLLLLPTQLLILFFLFFAIVIFIQFLFIKFSYSTIKALLTSLFISSNLILFKLINFEFINSLNNLFKFLIFMFFLLIFYRISIITNYKSRNKVLVSLLIISLVSIASITNDEKISIFDSHKERIQLPEFNQKPDVFLIGFDGFLPNSLVEEVYEYKTNLDKEYLLSVKNSFAPRIPTINSWLNILSLSKQNKYSKFAFSGHENTFLFDIFRNNGYQITSGFTYPHMGINKGKFIDDYLLYNNYNNLSFYHSIACVDNAKFVYFPKYYGLCSIAFRKMSEKFVKKLSYKMITNEKKLILDLFKKKEYPRLVLYHSTNFTRHAPSYFNYEDSDELKNFKDEYITNYQKVEEIINEIAKEVMTNNRDAIVLIFGDHGTFIYRKNRSTLSKHDKTFINDYHAINQLFVKSTSSCINQSKYRKKYSTPSREIAGVIYCLSVDKINTHNQLKSFDDRRKIHMVDKLISTNFEKYLYE